MGVQRQRKLGMPCARQLTGAPVLPLHVVYATLNWMSETRVTSTLPAAVPLLTAEQPVFDAAAPLTARPHMLPPMPSSVMAQPQENTGLPWGNARAGDVGGERRSYTLDAWLLHTALRVATYWGTVVEVSAEHVAAAPVVATLFTPVRAECRRRGPRVVKGWGGGQWPGGGGRW